MQFGFMERKGTTDAIVIVRQTDAGKAHSEENRTLDGIH